MQNNFSLVSDVYRAFDQAKQQCRCCSLFDVGKKVVSSEGNADSPTFVFIGEGPGADEAKKGRPFIGKAGQRLRAELRKHPAFTKQNTLLTNLLPCRPPGNKFPSKHDFFVMNASHFKGSCQGEALVTFCMQTHLLTELKILSPKVIVLLGAKPLYWIRKETGISDFRGEWMFLDEFQCYCLSTYHPSYVLRCENDPEKQDVKYLFEQDIAMVAEQWKSVIENDSRMQMTRESWIRSRGMAVLEQIRNGSDV